MLGICIISVKTLYFLFPGKEKAQRGEGLVQLDLKLELNPPRSQALKSILFHKTARVISCSFWAPCLIQLRDILQKAVGLRLEISHQHFQ